MPADSIQITAGPEVVKHLAVVGAVPGVAIVLAGARNGPGAGRLQSQAVGPRVQLTWQAPGSQTAGAAVDVAAGGAFTLLDGDDPDKFIRVSVCTDFLSPGVTESQVSLADVFDNGVSGPDVAAADAAAGQTTVLVLTLLNVSDGAITWLKVWLDATDESLDVSGDGTTWSAPTAESGAVLLAEDLPASECSAVYLRRTIAADAAFDPSVLNLVHFSFNTLDP